jgi:hypothetical protein
MELKFVMIMQTKVLPEPRTAQLVTLVWPGRCKDQARLRHYDDQHEF